MADEKFEGKIAEVTPWVYHDHALTYEELKAMYDFAMSLRGPHELR